MFVLRNGWSESFFEQLIWRAVKLDGVEPRAFYISPRISGEVSAVGSSLDGVSELQAAWWENLFRSTERGQPRALRWCTFHLFSALEFSSANLERLQLFHLERPWRGLCTLTRVGFIYFPWETFHGEIFVGFYPKHPYLFSFDYIGDVQEELNRVEILVTSSDTHLFTCKNCCGSEEEVKHYSLDADRKKLNYVQKRFTW